MTAANSGLPDNASPTLPVVISFAFGDEYYHLASDRLRADCERLGIDHHIVAADLPAGTSWIDACRHKVQFMADCRRRFAQPLWWVDVDCRLLRPLPALGDAVDIGFFLRGFRDLRSFDPVALPRVLQPSILYLGTSAVARRFVALMSELEAAHPGQATDDWFLHEAWVRSDTQPCAVVMPPQWVQQEDSHAPQAVFDFGRSGQAATFKGQAEQHEIDLFSPARRKALFLREVSQALREGNATEVQFFLRKAWQIDPADVGLAQRVARGWVREGRRDEAERVLRQVPPTDAASDHVRRFRLDAALGSGDVDAAQQLAKELIAGNHPGDRDWALGRQLRIGLEQRARAARLQPDARPMLWWMEGPFPGNFGDILNPYLVEKLTGEPPRFGPKGEGVLAIGSTIRFARDNAAVWGAGAPRLTDRLNPRARYLAVRGPITARLVESCGAAPPAALGDPAAILPRLYKPRSSGARHALGVVLHHAHEGRLRFGPEVKVISVLRAGYAGIEAFIDELHQCERILSSSLHGLIVSHAYGIPAQWFTVVDEPTHAVPGDGTKFHDYHLSIGLEEKSPLLLEAGSLIDRGSKTSEYLPARPIDVDRLLDVAPWPLRHLANR